MAYNPLMLRGVEIPLPQINPRKHPNLVALKSDPSKTVLEYDHHSVVMNRDRRMAVYSACNIDGTTIPQGIPRTGTFRNEEEIDADEQVTATFYDLCSKIIDKGHLTKYEDVIWGKGLSTDQYKALGKTTNFYPNAVPQHRRMNRGMWSSLELYILDTEVDENDLKICMFTGPILDKKDPYFPYPVDGKKLQLPFHFWKIVMYKKDKKLYALGFMMSHKTLLNSSLILEHKRLSLMELVSESLYFSDYKHSKPYQVKVELIEELAGITLQADAQIIKPYQDPRPTEMVFKQIDVKEKTMVEATMRGRKILSPYNITNMVTE